MGYKEEGEDQGRRRTRSGGRGIPASSPPAKKEKKTPATPGTGNCVIFIELENFNSHLLNLQDAVADRRR